MRMSPDVSMRALCLVLMGQAAALHAHPDNGESALLGSGSLEEVARGVQPKVVKLFGAGGMRGLEAYQSGMLVSAEGHVLTVWSYVLDTNDVAVVLDDGRRFTATLIGADPLTEIAVLAIDAPPESLPHFDLNGAAAADPGTRVLAFSNLFGIATGNEPVSMLHGTVSIVAPLEARRGAFSTNYRGEVYIVDAATNNPGAAGGALTSQRGQLLGLLGKELRSELTGTWLNYAVPITAIAPTVEEIIAGRFSPPEIRDADRADDPVVLTDAGIVLVPDIVLRTPPFVDRVIPSSAAAQAGIRPDDLIVLVNSQVVSSCHDVRRMLERTERTETLHLGVLRGDAFLEFSLVAGDRER